MATTLSKEERSAERKRYANKIVEYALQCARLRAFGSHFNIDGFIEHIGSCDVNMYIEGYEIRLKQAADSLILLMTEEIPEVEDPA